MRRTSRPRADAGMTILEFVIALLIATLALGLASSLLSVAFRQASFEQLVAIELPSSLAFRTLRSDVIAASAAGGTWPEDDRLLLGYPGRRPRVSYEVRDGALIRGTYGGGKPTGRPVLRNVQGFGWLVLGGGKPALLIWVDTTVARHSGPRVSAGQRVVTPTLTRREFLVLSMRGGGGSRGW